MRLDISYNQNRVMIDIKELLLNNRGNKQILVKNSFWLGAIELGSKLVMFVVTIGLVRYWGTKEFGTYNLAFSYVAVFMIFGDFGLSTIFTREVAKHKDQSFDYLGNILGLKLALAGIIGVLFAISFFVVNRPVSLLLLSLALFYNWSQGMLGVFTSLFQAWEKMEMVFINRAFHYLGILIVALTIIRNHGGATELVIGYIAITFLSITLGIWQSNSLGIKVGLASNLIYWQKLIREALPLLGMTAATTIYVNNDTLLIGRSLGNDQVGLYQTAYKILFAFQSVNVINSAVFPRITVLLHQGKVVTASKLIKLVVIGSLLVLVPLGLLITYNREIIMKTIYGQAYVVSAGVMSLLIWAGVINYFRQFVGGLLVARNRQKNLFYAVLLGMVVNLLLNYLLISRVGFVQAGWSMIISESIILMVAVIGLRR